MTNIPACHTIRETAALGYSHKEVYKPDLNAHTPHAQKLKQPSITKSGEEHIP